MSKFDKLTKFIPALDSDAIGEWVVIDGVPRVEYWDVVFRFCDAAEDFAEANPDYTEFPEDGADEEHRVFAKILHTVRLEPSMPGLLYGCLRNGTVREWLKKLK